MKIVEVHLKKKKQILNFDIISLKTYKTYSQAETNEFAD